MGDRFPSPILTQGLKVSSFSTTAISIIVKKSMSMLRMKLVCICSKFSWYPLIFSPRLQTHISSSLLTGFEPHWTSFLCYQELLETILARLLLLSDRSCLSEHHSWKCLGFFLCLWLCCLVLRQIYIVINVDLYGTLECLLLERKLSRVGILEWQSMLLHDDQNCYKKMSENLTHCTNVHKCMIECHESTRQLTICQIHLHPPQQVHNQEEETP